MLFPTVPLRSSCASTVRLIDQRQRDPKRRIRQLRSRDRLKHEIDRRTLLKRRHLRRNMRQHTTLRRNRIPLPNRIDQPQQVPRARHIIGRRVDPDHRIARPQKQSIDHRRRNPNRIVRRMIRLQPRRKPPGQSHRRPKPRHHANLPRHRNQILHSHDLRDSRSHLRRQSRSKRSQRLTGRLVRQQPIAKSAHRKARDRSKRRPIVRIDNQPRHLILLVRNDSLIEKRTSTADRQAPSAPPHAPPNSAPQSQRAHPQPAPASPWQANPSGPETCR